MAWVRIEDTVTEHRKHLKAGPAACWLWVCGIAYSQRQLTDGFIPDEAVPLLGVAKGAKALAEILVTVGLFDRAEGGYRVHDYHDYNRTREEAERTRVTLSADRTRAGRAGGLAKASKQASKPLANEVAKPVALALANSSPDPTRPDPDPKREKERVSLSVPRDAFTDAEITERAGRFIERYQALYPTHRHGARYAVKPARDYDAAVTLCRTWADDDRLDKLAVCFLTTDHKFAAEGSRTISQFLALASWVDGELSAWERSQESRA